MENSISASYQFAWLKKDNSQARITQFTKILCILSRKFTRIIHHLQCIQYFEFVELKIGSFLNSRQSSNYSSHYSLSCLILHSELYVMTSLKKGSLDLGAETYDEASDNLVRRKGRGIAPRDDFEGNPKYKLSPSTNRTPRSR